MILPLGDSPNPRGVPFVTYGLILANVAVYILITVPLSAMTPDPRDPAVLEYVRTIAPQLRDAIPLEAILQRLTAYDLFVFEHGFRPNHPSIADLFASMFLHGGLMHLFGNMLFLWIYGDNVEHRLGSVPFLLAYLGTGVAATLLHTFLDLGSSLPLVGASGAISGVLGFYFLWFPRNQVRLLVLLFPFLMDVILVPARLVLGLYLLLDNLLPFLVTRGTGIGGVAYGAHIGGFLAGLVVAKLVERREWAARPREYRRGARADGDGNPLRQALEAGDFARAAQIYFSLDADASLGLLRPAEMLEVARWLQRNGHARAALALYRRYLRDNPTGRGAAEAHAGAGLVQLHDLHQLTPAYQHFLDALDLDPSPEVESQARAGLAAIAGKQKLRLARFRN